MLGQLISFRKGALVKFLLSNDDIKLIHIWRRNVLERYLSGLVARRKGFLSVFAAQPPQPSPPLDLLLHTMTPDPVAGESGAMSP